MTPPLHALVLSGGGVFGAAHLGVLHHLWFERAFRVVAGTSIGAIIGTLLVLGHAPIDLLQRVTQQEKNFFSTDTIDLDHFGVTSQERIRAFVRELILEKVPEGVPTFAQVYTRVGVDLLVTGTNLTVRKAAYFDRFRTPDTSVLDALMISSCVPLVFPYITMNDQLYVDGFVTDNFCIRETRAFVNRHFQTDFDVFGLHLIKPAQEAPIQGIRDYVMALFTTFMDSKTYTSDDHVFEIQCNLKCNPLFAQPSDLQKLFLEGSRQWEEFSLKELPRKQVDKDPNKEPALKNPISKDPNKDPVPKP